MSLDLRAIVITGSLAKTRLGDYGISHSLTQRCHSTTLALIPRLQSPAKGLYRHRARWTRR